MKKICLAALCLAAYANPGAAQNLSDALRQCGSEQNSLKRLVCYDKIVDDMDSYSGLNELLQQVPAPLPPQGTRATPPGASVPPPAPVASTRQPQPQEDQAGTFGFENRKKEEVAQIDKIYADVASVDENAHGELRITLTNGQLWGQIDGGHYRVREGEKIYIERGVLNSFFLGKDDLTKRIRVKRLK